MSGNPFRRNAPPSEKLQAEEQKVERTPSPFKVGKKKKTVKIQTPPQSPEEVPRRLSAGNISPPPPERDSSSDDESDTTATADSDIEQALRNTRRNSGSLPPPGTQQAPSVAQSPAVQSPATTPGLGGAPYNPFARTLAENQAAFGLQRSKNGQQQEQQATPENEKKGRMNVDMFKNILMTGSPAPTPPQQTQHQQDHSSSNTESSSVSKNSLFDQNYNLHPESPRSSFDERDYSDEGEADDERGGLMGPSKERLDDFAPPAPPKAKVGTRVPERRTDRGPQTVSFAEFEDFSPAGERSQSPANAAMGDRHRPLKLQRKGSDMNKPLPKTPPLSPGLPEEPEEAQNIDRQVEEPLQPPTPIVTAPEETAKKAPPPPPPTSRRAGQTGTPNRARSTSDANENTEPGPTSPPMRPQDNASKPAPPPPPSRKSKPAPPVPSPAVSTPASEAPPNVSIPAEQDSKGMQPPPAPAPRRNPSTKTGTSMHRSPSSASHSSAHSHLSHAAPPAPPPRRVGGSKRESLDGAAHPNSFDAAQRRSSQNSFETARTSSLSKPTLPSESEKPAPQETHTREMQSDILADMSAFQAEIDALRKQSEGRG